VSRHVPATAFDAPSGPEKLFAASQDSRPDVVSVPEKLTVRGALYQPFAFGEREAVAVACGAVASYLRLNEAVVVLPALSRHWPMTAVVVRSGPA
jgi:hypothetical protein